ncbi:MAG: radical SAM protein [Spirochaetaceae bacterium]|nr:radical SAM protein [Spirochaetaceae bacterium]
MKILFVQLPVQDPSWDSAQANVPLAAGYLAAFAEKRGLLARDEWRLLPREISDYGSDSAVADAIVREEADLVCFSLYLWNLERSRHVAGRVAILYPQSRLVAGGPEVVSGMPIFAAPGAPGASPFHVLVEGEGELAFAALLGDLKRGRPLQRRYAADAPLDLAELPNPYLAGTLRFEEDRPVHLETMRGCPARCGYCYYGKNYPVIRRFPRGEAELVVEEAGRAGVKEVYLMDPSFQATEGLPERLMALARANSAGMNVHAELRLESVTEELGRLYAAAGLVSAEVGLQSTNPKALEAVGRGWDRRAFERGAEILQKNRVVVKTGLILGLPFDGYEDVIATFDFLGMQGLGQDAELYPLSLLPGTEVREKADDWGMGRMDKPPYWVTSTDWISQDDLIDAIGAFEDGFDVEWATPPAPHFKEESGGFVSFVDARRGENLDWMRLNPGRLANSVTLLVDADDPEGISRLARAAKELRRDNPYSLYQIVYHSDTRVPSEKLSLRLSDAFSNPDHYYDLSRSFSLDPQPSYQTRSFFATKNPSLAYRAMEEAQDLETCLVVGGKGGFNADRLAEQLPFVIFDRDALPFDRLYELLMIYADYRHMLVEAPEELFR